MPDERRTYPFKPLGKKRFVTLVNDVPYIPQGKTDEQMNKTDEQIRELKASQAKTDEQLSGTIKKLDEIGRQLGDLGLLQGEVAKELFFRNLSLGLGPVKTRYPISFCHEKR